MIRDTQWPVARLIPISSASGVEAQERRAASSLLAVIGAVDEFGRALLKPLGAPVGRIESFIEVPFQLDGRSIRPDGIIMVTRGERSWSAIVETKVGSAQLYADQIEIYLDLARDLGFDAVLSISNHYVTSSSGYPIEIDKRKTRKVALHHWSWVDVLTQAVVQKQHRGVSDRDQAYILGELIRYLSDPRSGAVSFDSMGPSWTHVKDGTRNQTLRKTDEEVAAIAARWDDLIRYLGLDLTKELGRDVRQLLSKDERTPAARLTSLKESLVSTGQLHAELVIPDTAGSLRLTADLRSRQILASTSIDAPRDGRSKGRTSWLLRQLQGSPEDLKIESRFSRSQQTAAATLGVARENPEILYGDGTKDIRQFSLTLTRNIGLKRDRGKGSFIDCVIDTAEDFYAHVLQRLRAWKAAPPKLRKDGGQEVDAPIEATSEVVEAIQEAAHEMETDASASSGGDS